MSLPDIYHSMSNLMAQDTIDRLLKTNEESKRYGLTITEKEAKEIIISRNNTLKSLGRIEFDINVTEKIMQNLCKSPFINKESYFDTINEFQEIFYYMKNETEDSIGDNEIIEMIDDLYNNSCGGSIEFLKEKVQCFSQDVRCKNQQMELSLEEHQNF